MKLLTAVLALFTVASPKIPITPIETKPNPVFCDNMVLQQGMPVPIWGTAPTGQKVTVVFQNQRATTTARGGRWAVKLKPLCSGGPFTMTISGGNTVRLNNILVGEVWLASGQSNMAWPLSQTEGAEAEIAASADPFLRQATVPRDPSLVPVSETQVKWREAAPDTSGEFSAVAYYFAKELRQKLGCPVAIINAARGGTRVEAWMSERALRPFQGLFDPRLPKNNSEAANWNTASALWNGIIAPVVPYAIRGVIWYQGESNAGNADLYARTFPAMIEDWRRAWGRGNLPFLFVQLAPFGAGPESTKESTWALLREAQMRAAASVPNTAMAVITDLGDCEDIHPRRKKPVGQRLASAALALAYSVDCVYKGPSFKRMAVSGDRVVLDFADAVGGLVARDGDLVGFTVAGEDRVFHEARAHIIGSRVVVSSSSVSKPVAVRYGWADCPKANLFNRAGFPASPFRTDSWPAAGAK